MVPHFFRSMTKRRAARHAAIAGGVVEPALARLVKKAMKAFDAPIAAISLLHDDKQVMLASSGASFRCMPRQESFCRYAVDGGDMFEVCDASADPRFARLPVVVGEPKLRYYLGAPFWLSGSDDAGALCIVDVRARRAASRDERAYLTALSRQVGCLLERRLVIDSDLAA